jgi:hypothetical protein
MKHLAITIFLATASSSCSITTVVQPNGVAPISTQASKTKTQCLYEPPTHSPPPAMPIEEMVKIPASNKDARIDLLLRQIAGMKIYSDEVLLQHQNAYAKYLQECR